MQKLSLEKDQETGEYRFKRTPDRILPLCEGKCPPAVSKNGKAYYPKPSKCVDPEIGDKGKYSVRDKDEFYDYVTVCNHCGTEFIATQRGITYCRVRNYCPGCGERLVSE